jgi:hypothetical protein
MKKEEILLKVFTVYPRELIRLIIWYGSHNTRDIDIFIVINWDIDYHHAEIGKFDFTIVGEKWLGYMLKHFDPTVTEPLLTGDVVWGEVYSMVYRNWLIYPNIKQTNEEISHHLLQKANRSCNWAIAHCNSGRYREASVTLSFSVSYIYFADYYQTEKYAIRFSKLIELYPNSLLTKILEYSKNQEFENVTNMKEFIKEIRDLLLTKTLDNK